MTELENSQVWSGPPKPVVGFHTAADAERAEPAARGRVADGPRDLAEAAADDEDDVAPVWKPTTGLGGPDQT